VAIFALTLSVVSEDWFGDQEVVIGVYMQAMGWIESKTAGGNICLDIVSGVRGLVQRLGSCNRRIHASHGSDRKQDCQW
jgi:hypothetical protein